MTYSVTVTGTKEEVANAVETEVGAYHPAAAEALKKIVFDELKGDRVSLTASGHDHSCSLSVSSWMAGEAQAT